MLSEQHTEENNYCTFILQDEIKQAFGYQTGGRIMEAVINISNNAKALKEYIERLNLGESLGSVQKDFRESFGSADAADIVQAEKRLIEEGTPVSQVQKLCDLHSALFHGDTRRERIENAENAVIRSLRMKKASERMVQEDSSMPSARSVSIKGHPLNILARENEAFSKRLDRLHGLLQQEADARTVLECLQDLASSGAHYDKKDELILPPLKRHGIQGPADVMWNVDGELRKANKAAIMELEKAISRSEQTVPPKLAEEIVKSASRMKEMIFKEDKILYPLAEKNFTEKEWQQINQDMPRFGYAWIKDIPKWDDAAESVKEEPSVVFSDGTVRQAEVKLPGGSLSLDELEGILRTLPVELTFIDAEDTNRYFSEDSSLFPRAMSALGHKVYECHPPKVIPVVQNVIRQLRSGEKDVISFVTPKHGRKALVRYMAVRSGKGAYLGTLEVVEDITDIA